MFTRGEVGHQIDDKIFAGLLLHHYLPKMPKRFDYSAKPQSLCNLLMYKPRKTAYSFEMNQFFLFIH